jgi:hypothetical protein
VHGVALDEDRGGDVVAAIQSGQEFGQQVALVRLFPQMMVGIHNRQFRLQRRFRPALRQQGGIRRKNPAIAKGLGVIAHGVSSAAFACGAWIQGGAGYQ